MGINILEEDVPDATTLLKFRHLMEERGLGQLFFDAAILDAPTKNKEKTREGFSLGRKLCLHCSTKSG